MDRGRLLILVVCALATTTIEPFAAGPNFTAAASREPSEAPRISMDELSKETADQVIVDQILRRLSRLHTALPERERIALVRAILEEARRHDLDPDLVVAVIQVESAGYHLAVSRVGALGLMQILPSTGKELANRLDIVWNGPDTLFDPIINVKLGTAYLRQLADQFGSVDVALAVDRRQRIRRFLLLGGDVYAQRGLLQGGHQPATVHRGGVRIESF